MTSALRVDQVGRRPVVPGDDIYPLSIDPWLLESLLASCVDSVSIIGQDGLTCFVTARDPSHSSTGGPAMVVGQSWLNQWPVACAGALAAAIAEARSGKPARCDIHCENERGELRWLEVCFSPRPRNSEDDRETLVLAVARDITDRRVAIESAELLARELQHRYCNMLSMVQAIVRISAETSLELAQFIGSIEARIDALARSHNLLTRNRDGAVDISILLGAELAPYFEINRVSLDGPTFLIGEPTASAFSLAIHELTSNAVKYGGLSCMAGRLSISWSIDSTGRLQIAWRETGCPGLLPGSAGFGSMLLDDLLSDQLHVGREWCDDGLLATISFVAPAVGDRASD